MGAQDLWGNVMSASTASTKSEGGLSGLFRRQIAAARDHMEHRVATTLSSAFSAAGLRIAIQPSAAQSPAAPVSPVSPPVPPATATATAAAPGPAMRPFPPADSTPFVPPSKAAPATAAPPANTPIEPARNIGRKVQAPPAPQGPTPVQVMTAVQSAVVGAVRVVSGTIDGVGAAMDAGRAASKTATGAASLASGVATVASGFFPQLSALGIGVPKAPKSRTGAPPCRKLDEILANPIGRAKPVTEGAAAPSPRPTKRVQRLPMVRPKSSLDLARKESAPKPRSYNDLQMRPQIGLTPHEILLKVATITLGKTLLGFLESGARSQQKALQRVSERMSQKQIMLLGMLPAQFIVSRLPPQQPVTTRPETEGSTPSESVPGQTPSGFKLRY